MYCRPVLRRLIAEHALKISDTASFQLASGKMSNYYLDCRQVTLLGEASRLIAEGLLGLYANVDFDAVAGMSIGADPIIGAMLALNPRLRGLIVRKEAKAHGAGRKVEGPMQPGDRVLIVEDVVTTGASALHAAADVREAIDALTPRGQSPAVGAQIVGVAGIVDRLEGAENAIRMAGFPLRTLFSVQDFGV